MLELTLLPFSLFFLALATPRDAGPIVLLSAGERRAMPRVVCLGAWTGLSPKMLTHTVTGWWSITSVMPCVISVRCRIAVRGWFWRKHGPAAGVETRTATGFIGKTVTIVTSRTFRDVEGSFKAPVLARLASETVLAGGSLVSRTAMAGA